VTCDTNLQGAMRPADPPRPEPPQPAASSQQSDDELSTVRASFHLDTLHNFRSDILAATQFLTPPGLHALFIFSTLLPLPGASFLLQLLQQLFIKPKQNAPVSLRRSWLSYTQRFTKLGVSWRPPGLRCWNSGNVCS
jgi:hypothetical protein